MAAKLSPDKIADGPSVFTTRRTLGTIWAEEHLKNTYKKVNEAGELVMLTPPPIRLVSR